MKIVYLDVERPRFTVSCPHNIEVFARKNMDSAVVMLSSMNATDNSREVPTIKVTGQKHNYTTGRHEITITAMDASGNKETCRFFIYVKSKFHRQPMCWAGREDSFRYIYIYYEEKPLYFIFLFFRILWRKSKWWKKSSVWIYGNSLFGNYIPYLVPN